MIWHASINFTTRTPMHEDTPFDLSDRLSAHSPAMSVDRDWRGGAITVCVEADTAINAASEAMAVVSDALTAEDLDWTTTAITVQNEDVFSAELNKPLFPEVVGYAEIAKLVGVSRQRARQFAEKPSFPAPVIKTAQGPLFNLHAVERWLETRTAS